MKNIILVLLISVFPNFIFAAFTPTGQSNKNIAVDANTNVLVNPTAAQVISANPEFSDFFKINGWQVNIDTTPSVNAYDAQTSKTASLNINMPYFQGDSFEVNADPNMGASTDGGWSNVSATKGDWTAFIGTYYMTYIENADLTNDVEAASLGIKYAVNFSTKSGPEGYGINAGFRNNKISLLSFAGQTIKIKVSFYAKKLIETSAAIQIRTNAENSTNNTTLIKEWNGTLFNSSSWTKIEETFEYSVSASTSVARPVALFAIGGDVGSYSIANFNFEVLNMTAAVNSDGTPFMTSYQIEYSVPKNTEWTDGEFKILDADGNLIYWVSTQWGTQMGGEYESNPATDLNAKIFYTSPENEANGSGKGREWIEYVHNSTNARTIYEHAKLITGSANPTISGIVIQPNFSGTTVGGTSIQSIFGKNALNAPQGNQYIYLKCSPTSIEKTKDGLPVWRTVVPQPIQ